MVTARGEATRSRILEATVDLLVEGGREKAGLDAVLRATSTSKSQLFHYFPGGKEELIRTATGLQMERALKSEVSEFGVLDTWEMWRAWIDRVVMLHLQQAENDACEVAALAGRSVDVDPVSRRLVGSAFEQWMRKLAEGLESMKDKGLLRPDANVDDLASAMLASLEGGAVIDRATGSRRHLGAALESSYTLLRTFASTEGPAAPSLNFPKAGIRRRYP